MIKSLIKKFISNKKCSVCNSKLYSYIPISNDYLKNLHHKKFHIPVTSFQTLNYENYTCPVCGGNDRDRLIAYYLRNKLSNENSDFKVLEIAPSRSLKLYFFPNQKVNYRTTDLFMEDVDDKLDIQNMDIYLKETFDLIICSHVLEHIPDDEKALKELYRILKKDGECLLLVPIPVGNYDYDEELGNIPIPEREKRFGQDDHLRIYSQQVFENRINDTGFSLKHFRADTLTTGDLRKYGILPTSVLYIGCK